MEPGSLQFDIGNHVSWSKIPGPYHRTTGHEATGHPLSHFSNKRLLFKWTDIYVVSVTDKSRKMKNNVVISLVC